MMPAIAPSLYHEVNAKAVNQQQQQIIKYGQLFCTSYSKAHILAIGGWAHTWWMILTTQAEMTRLFPTPNLP